MMNLSEYIEHLKSKPLYEYTLAEVQLMVEDIVSYYKATKGKEEKKMLRGIYIKVVGYYNDKAIADGITKKPSYNKEIV